MARLVTPTISAVVTTVTTTDVASVPWMPAARATKALPWQQPIARWRPVTSLRLPRSRSCPERNDDVDCSAERLEKGVSLTTTAAITIIVSLEDVALKSSGTLPDLQSWKRPRPHFNPFTAGGDFCRQQRINALFHGCAMCVIV